MVVCLRMSSWKLQDCIRQAHGASLAHIKNFHLDALLEHANKFLSEVKDSFPHVGESGGHEGGRA